MTNEERQQQVRQQEAEEWLMSAKRANSRRAVNEAFAVLATLTSCVMLGIGALMMDWKIIVSLVVILALLYVIYRQGRTISGHRKTITAYKSARHG